MSAPDPLDLDRTAAREALLSVLAAAARFLLIVFGALLILSTLERSWLS